MILWGFIEIASFDAYVKLAEYQWKHHGTKLDRPLMLWTGGVNKPIQYPTLEEIKKTMRRPPEHQKRIL